MLASIKLNKYKLRVTVGIVLWPLKHLFIMAKCEGLERVLLKKYYDRDL